MLVDEFFDFVKKTNILSMAFAFVMAEASHSLVKSFVNHIFMPCISPFLGNTSWQDAVLHLGPFHIFYGAFLAEVLNFLILAFAVFIIAKRFLKLQKLSK